MKKVGKKVDAVLFDLDGTLYDNTKPYGLALKGVYNFLYKNKYFDGSFDDFTDLYGEIKEENVLMEGIMPLKNHRYMRFKKLLTDLNISSHLLAGLSYDLYNIFWDIAIENMVLRSGVLELLKQLKGQGLKLAIVSNGETFIRIRKLKKLGILQYFDCVITGEEAGLEKPNPSIFLYTLNQLGVLSSNAIMVGDDLISDIFGAKEVGCMTVLLDNGFVTDMDQKNKFKVIGMSKPDFVIKKLGDLNKFIN